MSTLTSAETRRSLGIALLMNRHLWKVPCDFCGARPDKCCTTKSTGRPAEAHKDRVQKVRVMATELYDQGER